ncbi:LysR substrate-binding domain-containing protein [Rhodalgimonas zhirmunskyi]|uniref:LysR substrate-binding domain-containing protein n=1 Tax=Rhodalgimonas zhirmunskyi TaxID=2964767 RepID=A0AAJ1U8G0_9RHOB|nr:LysR substrate-binding domain-containing protein [Rhodoalgimonas zhirmunskyi]MDQ2093705.1 LysR substrate-binding domain-containing protein [Rhodoalgimonas zhirmunskyi]
MPLREQFLAGMARTAATVNVVTTNGASGRGGVTVSAMSSVSADTPRPTLLICVNHQSSVAQQIIENGVFALNILKDDQAYISDTFAGRFKDQLDDKFDCCEWVDMPSGAPRVRDPLVGFDCHVMSADRVGTHYVFFGEVDDVFIAEGGSPLIYARRGYGTAARIEAPVSVAAGKEAEGRVLSVAAFHAFGPILLPDMIRRMTDAEPGLRVDLIEGDQGRITQAVMAGEADVALVYDPGAVDGLDLMPLTELQPYVLLAQDHPLAEKAALAPEDLAGHAMVLLGRPPSSDYFTGLLHDAGVEPQVAFRSSNLEMVRGLVGQGLGFALMATRPASTMAYDGSLLVTRPLTGGAQPARVMLATRKGATLTPAVERFIWFCRDFFDLHH